MLRLSKVMNFSLVRILALAVLPVLFLSSSCESTRPHSGGWQATLGPVPVEKKVTPEGMLDEVGLKQDMIPRGTYGRRYFRPMLVRYITIHATENPTGNAYQHALALKRGALRAPKRKGGNR